MESIDLRRARELVIDVAEGREGYRYERRPMELPDGTMLIGGVCDYVRDGKPSCIVGHVLFRAGVPIEILMVLDPNKFGAGIGAESLNLPGACRGLVFDVTDEAAEFLSVVQRNQDQGKSWGECAEQARNWGTEGE